MEPRNVLAGIALLALARRALKRAALAALALTGCSPTVTVVRETQPNPFSAHVRFAVEDFTVGDVRIAEDPTLPATLDEPRLNGAFRSHLAARGLPVEENGFVLRAHLGKGAPRWAAAPSSDDGRLRMWVGVFDAEERPLDQLEIACPGDVYSCAAALGDGVARHLGRRVGVAPIKRAVAPAAATVSRG